MTDTELADELIGTLIDGRYRVLDRLARGGMATVYTARDERLERTVALKMVHPSQAGDPTFVERFVAEARAVAKFSHPNVVAAYDQGTHQGLPYLVMEYVRGRTLREILRSRRRLTPAEALAIAEQMAAGIAAAHHAGLVHRDIKPENVLISQSPSGGSADLVDSVVKVTDFGLAEAFLAASDGDPTATSTLLATVAYVAPEVVRTGRADPRADVYSTGIVLFEMLTGRVPFDGPQPGAVAWQHVDQDVPPPSQYVAGLPRSVDELVVRATRRDPHARPADARQLGNELQRVRERVMTEAATTALPQPVDATVVLSKVGGEERPSWARLPSRPRSAPPSRRPTSGGVYSGGNRRRRPEPAQTARVRRWTLLASVAVVAVLLAGGGAWWLGVGRWMPAPQVVGLSEAEAVSTARQNGLRVEFTEPRYHDEIAAGHVLAQHPDDRIRKGGVLTLTLSLGPEIRAVPDVIGAELPVAIRQLEELDLEVVEGEQRYSDTVPAGRVMAVEPSVGEQVRPGDRVTVVVSKGRAPIEVPALIGLPLDQAQAQLAQLGLVALVQEVENDAPAGQVLVQDPAPGAGVEEGATVTLQVSKGPPTKPVPHVEGRPCGQARQILEQEGFEVSSIGNRRVRTQIPSPGTGLPPGSEVTIICV